MKKIIATVLAMVMALALCTTAFAASSYVLYDEDKEAVTDANDAKVMVVKTAASSKDKTTVYYSLMDGDDTTAIYVPATADDFTNYVENNYVKEVTGASDAMTEAEIAAAVTYVGKLTKKVEKSPEDAEISCTTSLYAEDVYVDAKDVIYVADEDGDAMLLNGVIIKVTSDEDAVAAVVQQGSHLWIKGDKVSDGVYNVKCAICGATSVAYQTLKLAGTNTVVKYDQNVGIDTANELDKTYEGELLGNGWYVATAKTATSTTTGTSSPKTFDAGIAMYVGMALTSVAGSAVVIGKKKEF